MNSNSGTGERLPALIHLSGSISMLLTSVIMLASVSVRSDDTDSKEQTIAELFEENENIELTQLDPVEVGFIRTVKLGDPGHFYDIETIAVKPPIFAIPNFLTDEECERIKHVARGSLRASNVLRKRPVTESSDSYYNDATFAKFDEDGDNRLDFIETMKALAPENRLETLPDNIATHIYHHFLDSDSDGSVIPSEFRSFPGLLERINKWIERYKQDGLKRSEFLRMQRGRDRVSKTTWLERNEYDPDYNITIRAVTLSELDPYIHFSDRFLQVVHYTPGGHYHAHYDSDGEPTMSCGHTRYLSGDKSTTGKACRFLTILYYLNYVEEGGETAFPIADNETYHEEIGDVPYWHKCIQTRFASPGPAGRTNLNIAMKDGRLVDGIDLTHHCHDANIVVRPKKGLAVMWYNHHIDEKTGWLGPKHEFSLHGGCDVIKGEKWIANTWIHIDEDYDRQIQYMKDQLSKLTERQEIKKDILHTEL